MSSSQSKSVISGITDASSISELIAVLHSSFRKEEYDEVERLLIRRERKLENELRVLQGKYVLLEQDHSRSVLKEISLGEELKSCRTALHESVEQADRLRGIGEMVCKRHSQVKRQLDSLAEELLEMEVEKNAEMAEKISELTKANEEALEKLRVEKENSLEDLMRLVDSLQGEIAKELEFCVLGNTSNDCQQIGIETEGGLPVSSPEVISRSVSPRQFSDGGNGVHGQVGGKKIQSVLDENVDKTTLGGHLTVEDLQNVISAAVKDAIAPLVPVAVTNRSLCSLEVISSVNDLNEVRDLHQITPEATDEAIPHTPAPFYDLTLSPRKTSESETRMQEHDIEEAVAANIPVPCTSRSPLPREIIEIDGSDDESPVSQPLKRQRILLD